MSKLTFAGAAGTVTGSRYLVEHGGHRVLVDCGLFQGWKNLRERNWRPLPFDPKSLDAVVLTHAHIDHSGYVPRLHELGYDGPIYCTSGTRDLLRVLLPDSGYLQEEQARHANKWGYSKHRQARPLYTRAQAERSLELIRAIPFHETVNIAPGMSIRCTRAGHILGAASVRLETPAESILFTGDVGRPGDPIMQAPEPPPAADVLVTESTYGDRRHPPEHVADALARVVTTTAERGGTVVIPAFAVGRSQHMLHLLTQLREADRIPKLPTYLDSPMAIAATRIFCRHPDDHRLSETECASFDSWVNFSRTAEDSKAIDQRTEPMVIISASGMATGGRVLHHLERFLPDERNTILLVGYQASGTRGRSLADGTDELKIHGAYVRVRASIAQIHGLSAHADYAEMLDWFEQSELKPRQVFVTHGEPAASDAFRRRLTDKLHWKATVPEDGSSWDL